MKQLLTLLLSLFISLNLHADEGMWMLGKLDKSTGKVMKTLGLKLPLNKLHHTSKPSLTDAVVSFGGFCSGVVVSDEGLVFTNHHCGFNAISQHSVVGNDLLRDGFVARSRSEELPNPELFVRFLIETRDVTERVLGEVDDSMNEDERRELTDSIIWIIREEVYSIDSTLVATVDPYYEGNEYWLSVYRDYNDVRLVFAPPSSIGKFGWDTDNWVWPRHTGDFSVFRIYAGEDNEPAEYSPDNVPYRPLYVAPVSLKGYTEGSFCMTLGYPGSTTRYISSYGIEEMMRGQNQAMIDIRGVKQEIWKREMKKSDETRLKYARKYDESSNYWKNSVGTNQAIRKLKVLERKREAEANLARWINGRPKEHEEMPRLFTSLEEAYKDRHEANRAMAYLAEAFFNSSELVQLALEILHLDTEGEEKDLVRALRSILEKYDDMDISIDKEVFATMLGEYRRQVDAAFLPDFYRVIDEEYNSNDQAFTDSLYSRSKLVTPEGLRLLAENDTTYVLFEDPAASLALDLIATAYDMNYQMDESSGTIAKNERLYNAAVRRMYAGQNFYPDANSTMRLSFGTVRGYTPADGVEYNHYTTTRGVLEKADRYEGDADFDLQPEIISALFQGDFGKYATQGGEMNVCFISDNDITGGNSGSAMFNANGELLGLAFDGNWEAMSGDVLYEPALQRCIGVDVRYMLYVMDKIEGAGHLIEELGVR